MVGRSFVGRVREHGRRRRVVEEEVRRGVIMATKFVRYEDFIFIGEATFIFRKFSQVGGCLKTQFGMVQ